MSLRLKLTLVGLVILVLPWSAWRFIGTAERLLREGEARAQLAATETLARALKAETPAPFDNDVLYAPHLDNALWVDGYGEDWPANPEHGRRLDAETDGIDARLRLAHDEGGYYLLAEVTDDSVIYRGSPTAGDTDHDQLRLDLPEREQPLIIDTAAPGEVSARTPDGKTIRAVHGAWRETGYGYSVELRIPRRFVDAHIGVSVGDTDRKGASVAWSAFGSGEARMGIVERRPALDERLAAVAPSRGRAWLIAPEGWVLGSVAREDPAYPGSSGGLLRNLVYRQILASPLEPAAARSAASMRLTGPEVTAALDGNADSAWRAAGGSGVLVSAAHPLRGPDGKVRAAVVTERVGDGVLLLTDSAMGQVLGTVLGAMGVALAVLVAYAARLSNRIRRLRDAATAAVDDSGAVTTQLPQTGHRDELDDLARGFSQTLTRLNDYTRYLRSLTSKLSHELRTPLAMVTSSLENLVQHPLDDDSRRFAERAQDGAHRLDRILRAMSEATRVEQSLASETFETFELTAVLGPLVDAYRDMHPDHAIRWASDNEAHAVHGSAELMGQLVDKLVDNAVGFTPDHGWIRIGVHRRDGTTELTIANQGPPLPDHMRGNLFDSLVSVREDDAGDDDRPHLGLGLYIVRVIAEILGGWVSAGNRDAGDGVVFTVHLPRATDEARAPSE